jgi:hypothetical protein
LQEGGIDALVTRDSSAYDAYATSVSEAYEGIDCAFFIDDWYDPPTLDSNFVAATFDKLDEPDIETDKKIIRPHHAPFDLLRDVYEGSDFVGNTLKLGRRWTSSNELETAYDELEKGNLYVSDNVRDYLSIYANASEVHADRIHACIPGLVYGADIKFYYDTPRGRLFDGFVNETKGDLEVIDRSVVDQQKKEVVGRTVELFETHA